MTGTSDPMTEPKSVISENRELTSEELDAIAGAQLPLPPTPASALPPLWFPGPGG
jgi:hypothetical protein